MKHRLVPTMRAAWLLGICSLLSAYPLWEPSMAVGVLVVDGLVVIVLAVDAWISRAARATVEREHTPVAQRGQWLDVELTVRSQVPWAASAVVHDRVFAQANAGQSAIPLPLSPRSESVVTYQVQPLQRGAHQLGPALMEIVSRLGFWRVIHDAAAPSTLDVYPSVRTLAAGPVRGLRDAMTDGRHQSRRQAGEQEFDRLRDWQADDTIRHVDWRATARRARMTVRHYKSEENQNIMLCLNGGRTMSSEVDGRPLFDHAMEAGLALAQLAIRNGDNAGCVVWSERVTALMPPARGTGAVPSMVRALYDQHPTLNEADDSIAARALLRLSRRSLLVWFTRLEDAPMASTLVTHVRQLDRRHLVLVVLLKDTALEALAYQSVASVEQRDAPWIAAGASLLLQEQRQAVVALERAGALVLETDAAGMTARLINTYLDVKARHRL